MGGRLREPKDRLITPHIEHLIKAFHCYGLAWHHGSAGFVHSVFLACLYAEKLFYRMNKHEPYKNENSISGHFNNCAIIKIYGGLVSA